jgi:hypothetical protein
MFLKGCNDVIPIGFEPMTYRLEICCSIQLSYGTIAIFSRCKYANFQVKVKVFVFKLCGESTSRILVSLVMLHYLKPYITVRLTQKIYFKNFQSVSFTISKIILLANY